MADTMRKIDIKTKLRRNKSKRCKEKSAIVANGKQATVDTPLAMESEGANELVNVAKNIKQIKLIRSDNANVVENSSNNVKIEDVGENEDVFCKEMAVSSSIRNDGSNVSSHHEDMNKKYVTKKQGRKTSIKIIVTNTDQPDNFSDIGVNKIEDSDITSSKLGEQHVNGDIPTNKQEDQMDEDRRKSITFIDDEHPEADKKIEVKGKKIKRCLSERIANRHESIDEGTMEDQIIDIIRRANNEKIRRFENAFEVAGNEEGDDSEQNLNEDEELLRRAKLRQRCKSSPAIPVNLLPEVCWNS